MAAEIPVHTTDAILPLIPDAHIEAAPHDLAKVARRVSGDRLPPEGQFRIIVAAESESGSLERVLDETTPDKPAATGYFLRRGSENPIVALVNTSPDQSELEGQQLTQAVADHYAARRYLKHTRNIGRAALYGGISSSIAGAISAVTEHYPTAMASLGGFATAVGLAIWRSERLSRTDLGKTPRFKDIESIKDYHPLRIVRDEQP